MMEDYINSDVWTEYFKLMVERPELFKNVGNLDIITDPDEIKDFIEKNNRMIGVIYKSAYSILVVDLVKGNKGNFAYERIIPTAKDGAVVIVPKCDGKYVLLRQFRHSIRRYQYCFPRGFGEVGVDSKDNVIKEIKEELGVKATNVEFLGKVVADSGLLSNVVSIYSCDVEKPNIEVGNEGIENVSLLSEEELKKMIKEDKIDDGFTLSAYSYVINKK